MEWIEAAAKILIGWTALSLIMAAGWSRFMSYLRCKEYERSAAAAAHRLTDCAPAPADRRAS